MATEFDPRTVELAISSGLCDDFLDRIQSQLTRRRDYLASERVSQLKVGDVIAISHTVKPKLLANCACRVKGFDGSNKVIVQLCESRSPKWRRGMEVTLPKTLVGTTLTLPEE